MINTLQNKTVSYVIQNSNIVFGTSGARGLVTDFSPEVCAAFTYAFINVMKENFEFRKVVIGIDNRPSSYAIAQACQEAIKNSGYECIYCGVLPTPALALKAFKDGIPCIMVTGSHIPFDRNGLKFYSPNGEITKEEEIHILCCDSIMNAVSSNCELKVSQSAAKLYIQRYVELFDSTLLAGVRIGIYEHSSAGRDIYREIFSKLGAEVISLGRSEEFVAIDTEAVNIKDRENAKKWSEIYSLDAIFSTDGDGDRPLLADEKGDWLRGDILGLICASLLKVDAIAVPVSCNTAIELSARFGNVMRTKIGSPYVIKAFDVLKNQYGNIAGFEANGGFILGSDIEINGKTLTALPTRDAVLPALIVLSNISNGPISSMVQELPKRFTFSDRIQNISSESSNKVILSALNDAGYFAKLFDDSGYTIANVNTIDGARFTFINNGVIHLRQSGNAPELRCYAEFDNEKIAEYNVKKILQTIATTLQK